MADIEGDTTAVACTTMAAQEDGSQMIPKCSHPWYEIDAEADAIDGGWMVRHDINVDIGDQVPVCFVGGHHYEWMTVIGHAAGGEPIVINA